MNKHAFVLSPQSSIHPSLKVIEIQPSRFVRDGVTSGLMRQCRHVGRLTPHTAARKSYADFDCYRLQLLTAIALQRGAWEECAHKASAVSDPFRE